MHIVRLIAAVLALGSAHAGDAKPVRCEQIDYGGFLGGSFVLHPDATYDNNTGVYSRDSCAKSIAVALSDGFADGVIFDIDSLRIAAAWTGGSPRLIGWWLNGSHGPTSRLAVPPLFSTRGPGWASPEGSLADPRADLVAPLPRPGPLPRAWAHYHGLYRHGRQTVFSYRVGTTEVLEQLALERDGGGVAIARTFAIAAHAQPLTVVLADAAAAAARTPAGLTAIASTAHAAIASAPTGASIAEVEDNLVLRLPPAAAPTQIKVLIAAGALPADRLAALAKAAAKPIDLAAMITGGPGLWSERIAVTCKRGNDDGPWAVDAIGLPSVNPYHAWLRPSALDFFADGTSAAVATLNGDVWVVSGIDDALATVTWRRFAAGLHAPLGLKIVDGVIHVACRDGILRLHDLDRDGEADFYESFNHDLLQTPSFHSFVCDLNTDPEGRFYFGVGGSIKAGGTAFQRLTPHLGTIMRLAKDGSVLETFATGCRMPNGGSVGPQGEVTTSDNQGVWVPATPIHLVKQGDFLGVCNTAHGATTHPPKPLCFLPQAVDSSACSQVWVTSERWGLYRGGMLHLSYGKAGVFAVLRDAFDGAVQGGVVRLPFTLTSAGLRGRFNPRDGQLYVVGLKMGQTTAVTEGGFDRIRATGKPACLPTGLRTLADGVAITFSSALDKAKAEDPTNWAAEAWNYTWTQGYGSPEVPFLPGAATPIGNKKVGGRSPVNVKAVTLSADGLTASLTLPDLKPVWNLRLTCKAATADGKPIDQSVVMTIHAMPAR